MLGNRLFKYGGLFTFLSESCRAEIEHDLTLDGRARIYNLNLAGVIDDQMFYKRLLSSFCVYISPSVKQLNSDGCTDYVREALTLQHETFALLTVTNVLYLIEQNQLRLFVKLIDFLTWIDSQVSKKINLHVVFLGNGPNYPEKLL